MANTKTGFLYISLQVNRYGDMDLKRLKKNFGGTGVAVYDYICTQIYRDSGCYLKWDRDTAFDVAEYWNIKETLLNEIVNYCCHVGLFDQGLLNSERLLSSKKIVENFIYWSKLAKRKYTVPEMLAKLLEESANIPEGCESFPEGSPLNKTTQPETTINKMKRTSAGDPAAGSNFYKALVAEKFSIEFVQVWEKWLSYKKVQFRFQYKHEDSHRAAITELFNLSEGNEITAGAIIQRSMANGWKGFFVDRVPKTATADPAGGPAAPQKIFDTVAARRFAEINYLFERYLEDESFCTVISIEHDHYDCLKTNGLVNFSESERETIREKAKEHIVNKKIEFNAVTELTYMKKFGVLQYFSKLKSEGKTVVFDNDHR